MSAVLAQARGPVEHMWGWAPGWMWLWMLVLLLVALAVILIVVWAVARSARSPSAGSRGRAREILDERYARGEISTEEYRERLDNLP